ncbi:Rieske (2Fe-2S) protein [Nonomuraea longicatena]|uniref:Cytochrome bc1 complex Rieske iron-sulfur subunit n=1 Tax=Nonomuraea longicatena TaxID=83682 RepID=A0ABP3ZHZ4_9ACTN
MIAGVGAGGLTLALAACGSGNDSATASAPPASGAPAPETPASSAPAAGAPKGALGSTSDVPVGGGKIFPAEKVVVTQPSAGTFKCFSAMCTHQGCAVSSVSNGAIVCPCHGSKFAVADGAVIDGPAKQPLPAKEIKVEGDQITLA